MWDSDLTFNLSHLKSHVLVFTAGASRPIPSIVWDIISQLKSQQTGQWIKWHIISQSHQDRGTGVSDFLISRSYFVIICLNLLKGRSADSGGLRGKFALVKWLCCCEHDSCRYFQTAASQMCPFFGLHTGEKKVSFFQFSYFLKWWDEDVWNVKWKVKWKISAVFTNFQVMLSFFQLKMWLVV